MKLKYDYPKINQPIKKYWLVQAEDYHAFSVYEYAYKQAGIKCKYVELKGLTYVACFYIGKKPIKFIKSTEYDLSSGNPF
jgi:hypothetical protein